MTFQDWGLGLRRKVQISQNGMLSIQSGTDKDHVLQTLDKPGRHPEENLDRKFHTVGHTTPDFW